MTETDTRSFVIEEWDSGHPRWQEFVDCMEEIVPDQVPFVLGPYSRDLPCTLFVALQEGRVVGFIRFGVQPIGPEAHCPPLRLDGEGLYEAKIHAFAVRAECRNQGIGKELQKRTVRRARELGCYQVASYSMYDRDANYHVKLSLGFAVQPEVHGDNEQGSYFLMPLRVPDLE